MFITFEGPEGSGKSENMRWLAEWLKARGHRVIAVREPGGTPLGERVRSLLLDTATPPASMASLLLFSAARAELVARVIQPELASGGSVLCDRFTDSTLAYQGYGEGITLADVRAVNHLATDGVTPDLTILLDVDVELGLERRAGSSAWNEIDGRPLDFHGRVRRGFLELAAAEPARWLVVDATRPLDDVRSAILEGLEQRLSMGAAHDGVPHEDGGAR